jgi:asparagine synthetase B (glutamine-hydrolysing)
MEWYVESGRLISEESWKKRISELCREKILFSNPETEISEKFLSAVEKRLPKDDFGVMLSGGVDSTLIAFCAKTLGRNPVCFSVGTEGSDDLKWAELASSELKLKLEKKVFSKHDFEIMIKETESVLKTQDPVTLSIGAVTYSALKLASSNGIKILFSGLGSEELFAGYDRHLKTLKAGGDVNAECMAGLFSMYSRDMMRDYPLADSLSCEIRTPFLDSSLIRLAMSIPVSLKIDDSEKKIILRKSAIMLGLPEKFAMRKKKAAQYGSGFDKELQKLGKSHGFLLRKDYVKSL